MDLAIALSQGLGLAVAAGFFATAPLAIGSSAAALGVADGALPFADDPLTVGCGFGGGRADRRRDLAGSRGRRPSCVA